MAGAQTFTLDVVKHAVGSAAAGGFSPVGGAGDKVLPPTFAGAVYALDRWHVPGRDEPVQCELLDSVQSQARDDYQPREMIVTSVSAHLGTVPAQAFPRLRRKDGSERRHTNAIPGVDERVRGPVLIGAGRYGGYVACRPLDPPREENRAMV